MIAKKLTFDEVQKFHKDLAVRIMDELRASDSKFKNSKPEKIEWAYSYEAVADEPADVRDVRRHVDRKIRLNKLLRLKAIAQKQKKVSADVEEVNQNMKDFFNKIMNLSLSVKIGDTLSDKNLYERFYKVEKTSLFESKIKEDMNTGNFIF